MIPVLVIKCFVTDVIQWMELPCPSGFSSVGFARARHLDSACLSVPRSPRDGGNLFQYGKCLDVQVGQENMHTQTHLCHIYIYIMIALHTISTVFINSLWTTTIRSGCARILWVGGLEQLAFLDAPAMAVFGRRRWFQARSKTARWRLHADWGAVRRCPYEKPNGSPPKCSTRNHV